MPEEFTIKDVYNLVGDLRKEFNDGLRDVKATVAGLESKFDLLEAGRVSAVEKNMAEVKAEHKVIKNIVFGACGFILLAVLGALVYLVIKR